MTIHSIFRLKKIFFVYFFCAMKALMSAYRRKYGISEKLFQKEKLLILCNHRSHHYDHSYHDSVLT